MELRLGGSVFPPDETQSGDVTSGVEPATCVRLPCLRMDLSGRVLG